MGNCDIVFRYFPEMSERQRGQIEALEALYGEWNARINVISRRDIDNLYTAHILHSLSIAAFLGPLEPGTTLLDMGTGGGLPGIPLAIAYPECRFHLIDRIGKNVERGRKGANRYADGLVCLKGGDLAAEIAATKRPVMEYDLREFIPEECYDTKKLIYVPYA